MKSAFYRCENINFTATDTPNLSGVTDMSNMFKLATAFNSNIDNWDVSHVTNMSGMFQGASAFNQPLNSWNTSSVISMSAMFNNASAFNHPLNNWDVSHVTNMWDMFYAYDKLYSSNTFLASAFNQNIDAWDVSHVTNFNFMFGGATAFNQPLNSWNLASSTSIWGMFQYSGFNQPLNNWNVSHITNMSNLFQSTPFNQDISGWNTSKVTQMNQMFESENISIPQTYTVSFNKDISAWDTSKVTSMKKMFRNNPAFDQNLAGWNVSSLTDATDMFQSSGLTQSNQNNTLQSWAAQPVKSNVPLNIGLKTYTTPGATALTTLRNTYNWTITEQYQAQYIVGTHGSLIGIGTQYGFSGATTTTITIIPDKGYAFKGWSDGSMDNPRTDIIVDTFTVTAIIESTGTQSHSGYVSQSNKTAANTGVPSSSGSSVPTPRDVSLIVTNVQTFANKPVPTDPTEKEIYRKTLIILLLQVVVQLTEMLQGVK